jgi:TRAP-type mannitol/chloroaromatic compound transport system substrate-binding protein
MRRRGSGLLCRCAARNQAQYDKGEDIEALAARTTASDVLGELAGKSPGAQKVHDSYMAFRDKISAWSRISLQAVLKARQG